MLRGLLLFVFWAAAALAQTADVGVAKSGPERMIIGFADPFMYQINIANAGPNDATNVVVTDQVPSQFTIARVLPTYPNSTFFCDPPVNNLVRCTIARLRVGDVARLVVNVTLPSNAQEFIANNTACITSSTPDPDLGNQCNSRVNPVVRSADLSVTIQGPAAGIAGQQQNVTQIVRVVNLGFSDAENVVSRFKIANPLTFQGVTVLAGNGTCAFVPVVSEVVCNFGTLASGGSFSYSVQQGIPPDALLPSGGSIVFWASVNSTTFDPNYFNNNATQTLIVGVESDVSVTKGSIPVVTAGNLGVPLFTIVVENAGPSTAADVIVTDDIPAPFILRSATIMCNIAPRNTNGEIIPFNFTKRDFATLFSSRQGAPCVHNLACTVNGNFLRCTSSNLNVIERIIIVVTVDVPATATPPGGINPWNVTNVAFVTSATLDNNPERNSDPAEVQILALADVSVVKTGFIGSIIAGDLNTYFYTITTTNAGPSIAQGVFLMDNVPAPFVVSANPTVISGQGSCMRNGNAIRCEFGNMNVNASVQVRVPFTVPASASTLGNIINTACVFSPIGDINSANNCSSWANLVLAAPDVNVTKIGPNNVIIGSNQTYFYTITVNNNGPSNAANGVLRDIVPAPFVVSGSVTTTQGSCSAEAGNANSIVCDLGALPFPSTVIIVIPFRVPVNTTAPFASNTAFIFTTTPDRNPSNNNATFDTVLLRLADLQVTKGGPQQLCAGEASGIFSVRVVNLGPTDSVGVTLVDDLPSQLVPLANSILILGNASFVSCSFVGQLLTCNLGNMASGASIEVRYNASVSAGTAGGQTVTNVANVTSQTSDPNLANNVSPHNTFVCNNADVAVTKTGPATATVGTGGAFEYVITVQNNGPAEAQTVTISDTIPLQFTPGPIQNVIVDGSGSCSYTNAAGVLPFVLQCIWPRLTVAPNAGSNFTVRIPFTIAANVAAATVVNCVTVSTVTNDINATNNQACATTVVSVLTDVVISKQGPALACAGDAISYFYTVTIVNNGPSMAQGVTISDPIPPQLTVLSFPAPAVTGPATCNLSGNLLTCTVSGGLAVGASVSVVFPFTVPFNLQASSVTNTATVTTSTSESNTANNQASFTTNICARADLSIVKSGPTSIVAGDANLQQFTLAVRNAGPAVAINVTVSDSNIPVAFFNVLSVSAQSGAQCTLSRNQANTSASVSCFYPQMNIGQTDTITITFRVPSNAAPGSQPNCANISSAVTVDNNTANNLFCINVLIVAQADLRTTKTGPATVTAGVNLPQNVYTVTVTNIGGSDAVQSTLVDQVPADFRLVNVTSSKGSCSFGGDNVVRCSFGTLVTGESVTVIYAFTVTGDVSNQPRQNLACANTTTLESRYDNNCAVVITQVICNAVNSISKTDNIAMIIAGNTTVQTFTIVVRNNGPSLSRDTVVTDTFPTAYTLLSGPTSTQGTCTLAGTGFVCNVGTLAVNATATILLSYRVAANTAVTSATNTACVANSCAAQASICATDTNTILQNADLFVIKDDCVSCAKSGSNAANIFTITVVNQGPSDAVNFVVRDTWPSQYIQGAITTSPAGAQCALTGGSFSCTWPVLPSGATAVITIAYTVATNTPAQYVTNCVVVSSSTPDNNTLNNEDCDTNFIRVEADLEVIKTIDNNDCVVAGSAATRSYTVVVTNKGPSTATNVLLFDQFPPDLIAVGPSGCTVVGSNYSCPLGDLPLGASRTLIWTFRVGADRLPGLVENKVSVTSPTFDPELCNNNATVCSIICAESDLAVTKTDNQLEVTAGDLVTYTYTIVGTNLGPSTARNVTFSDVFPREFTRGNVTAPNGTVTFTTDGFQVVIPVLRVGESYVIRVSYTVEACVLACDACNFVSISSPYEDSNETNNNAKDCTLIRTEANLEVCKDDGVSVVTAGDGLVYQYKIQVANIGPSCAQKVQLVDHFPAQVLQIPGTLVTSQGFCILVNNRSDFSCNLLTLRPGQNVTIFVNYTVPSSANTCSVCNLVTVSSLTFDPELCNNDAKDCNSLVERANLTITKSDGITTIVGTDLRPQTYTITVRNTGPSTARDVVLTDRWPAGFTQFLQSLTISSGRCVGVGRDFTCSLGDMAVGNTTIVTVSYSNMQPPMCGTVSNWVAVFSPTDDECRQAWDNNTVTCTSQTGEEVGSTSSSASTTSTSTSEPSTTTSEASSTLTPLFSTASSSQSTSSTPETTTGLSSSAQDATTVYTYSTEQQATTTAPQDAHYGYRRTTQVLRRDPSLQRHYEPRAPRGTLLQAKLMEVALESTGPRSFKVFVKNTMKRSLVLEGLSVQVTDKTGKVASSDLSLPGALVSKTACVDVLGAELHSGWSSSCEFSIAEEAAYIKVSARGTQSVRGGYHPVMGSAFKTVA